MEEGDEDKASADDIGIPISYTADKLFASIIFPAHRLESRLKAVQQVQAQEYKAQYIEHYT